MLWREASGQVYPGILKCRPTFELQAYFTVGVHVRALDKTICSKRREWAFNGASHQTSRPLEECGNIYILNYISLLCWHYPKCLSKWFLHDLWVYATLFILFLGKIITLQNWWWFLCEQEKLWLLALSQFVLLESIWCISVLAKWILVKHVLIMNSGKVLGLKNYLTSS